MQNQIIVEVNSEESNQRSFNTVIEAQENVEEIKGNPCLIDIAIYDLSKPESEQCLVSWSRIGGKWENF